MLDKAGIPEPGLRFSERIKMLVARERQLREACRMALTDIDKFLPEIRSRGQDLAVIALRITSDSLRAALEGEEHERHLSR